MARPKTGETPIRHVRVDDNLWGQLGEIAREQGRTVSAVVLDALRRYVADRADLATADAELAERRARKGARSRKRSTEPAGTTDSD